jgi:tRNA threonylcarbamoyladenosine modification (KEOPS) complex  Pcc1 subunit
MNYKNLVGITSTLKATVFAQAHLSNNTFFRWIHSAMNIEVLNF